MKRCTKCKELLELDCFSANKIYEDGKNYWCKTCYRDYNKDYANRNKDKFTLAQERYRKNHPGKASLRAVKWAQDNIERYREGQKWYQRLRKNRVRSVDDGTIDTASLLKIWTGNCAICQNTIIWNTKDTHLDHIIPISKGGIHSIKNVQWTCSHCNLVKSNSVLQ